MSNWLYKGENFTEIPEGYIGFVYIIECIPTGQKYIGRKIFYSTSRKIIKGSTRRKKTVTESTWKSYFGSSEYMQLLIKSYGKEKFRREILYLCKDKSSMSYLESKEIFIRDALLKDEYINRWITCQIASKNLKSLLYKTRDLHNKENVESPLTFSSINDIVSEDIV